MNAISLGGWKRPLRSFAWVAMMIPLLDPAATAQQANPLEQQLQELKQEYTATTQALELRMAALELQIEKQKEANAKTKEATVSIVDLAAEKAAQQVVVERSHEVGATFQGDLSSE